MKKIDFSKNWFLTKFIIWFIGRGNLFFSSICIVDLHDYKNEKKIFIFEKYPLKWKKLKYLILWYFLNENLHATTVYCPCHLTRKNIPFNQTANKLLLLTFGTSLWVGGTKLLVILTLGLRFKSKVVYSASYCLRSLL